MRSIIRFSVDDEVDGALANKLRKVLESANYLKHPSSTATYENGNINVQELAGVISDFWTQACGHPGPGRIDHVWMYSDNPPEQGPVF